MGVTQPSVHLPSWQSLPPEHIFNPASPPPWWWLGVGQDPPTDAVTELVGAGQSSYGSWPDPSIGATPRVVITCWASVRGLDAALAATRQHAVGLVPARIGLLGLVVVEMPGRVSRPVRDRLRQMKSAYPNHWIFGWDPVWNVEPFGQPLSTPPEVTQVASDLKIIAGARLDLGWHTLEGNRS